MAPDAANVAWLGFSIRDTLDEASNEYLILVAIIIGAIASYSLAGGSKIAVTTVTSGSALLLSGFADFAAYFPLRTKGKIKELLVPNAVGLFADPILFLYLTFEFYKRSIAAIVDKTVTPSGIQTSNIHSLLLSGMLTGIRFHMKDFNWFSPSTNKQIATKHS
jgi:uncharacterized membrane protein HdeD (DUF308 family)